MSCPQIWEREKEKDREKEKVRWQASEAQREKDLGRDRKNKGEIFVGGTTWTFCSVGENASSHQGENEQQWKKIEQEHVWHFLHKMCK